MRVAFYKAQRGGVAGFFDWLIRTVTRAPYSHCELVFLDGLAFSASIQDGGCRFKTIEFNPAHWDFIDVPMTVAQGITVLDWCRTESGSGYDFPGVFRFLLPWIRESKHNWFCSEICCAALQQAGCLPGIKPWQVHPFRLFQLLSR